MRVGVIRGGTGKGLGLVVSHGSRSTADLGQSISAGARDSDRRGPICGGLEGHQFAVPTSAAMAIGAVLELTVLGVAAVLVAGFISNIISASAFSAASVPLLVALFLVLLVAYILVGRIPRMSQQTPTGAWFSRVQLYALTLKLGNIHNWLIMNSNVARQLSIRAATTGTQKGEGVGEGEAR